MEKYRIKVKVVGGKSIEKYIDLGYIDPDSIILLNGLKVINTTHHTLELDETRGEKYVVDKKVAKENKTKNKELNPANYDDEYEILNHKELLFTEGKRGTVYVAKNSHNYHIDTDCEEFQTTRLIYKVFLQDAKAENRTLCESERKSM